MNMKLGQNFVKYFVRFLGNGVTRKTAFEIYRKKDFQINVAFSEQMYKLYQN